MTNQEAIQACKAKEAHLKDSISQLRKELEDEIQLLSDIRKEHTTLVEEACEHDYVRTPFFCGNDCEYLQVCKHCSKIK